MLAREQQPTPSVAVLPFAFAAAVYSRTRRKDKGGSAAVPPRARKDSARLNCEGEIAVFPYHGFSTDSLRRRSSPGAPSRTVIRALNNYLHDSTQNPRCNYSNRTLDIYAPPCVVICITQAEARKEALEEERAMLETASKGGKAKPVKGKAGKK